MRLRLKPLGDQVLVITGASSGIGLVTARLAAAAGARVVLVARNAVALDEAVAMIRDAGGRAVCVVADVANPDQVQSAADMTIDEFGGFDTWVNNAGVGLYGTIMQAELADMRRQFDVNYWGAVYGCRAAVHHLRERGGAIVNVASALADRAIPLQGNYCASKHALKAFTDSLRMELAAEHEPISISLVKPGSMDTPLFEKAKTYLDHEPQPVPPVYRPEVAAGAILRCATRRIRDVIAGGMGKVIGVAGMVAPALTDRFMEQNTFDSQMTDIPVTRDRKDNLYAPVAEDGGERGRNYSGRVKKASWYTTVSLRRGPVIGAVGLGLAALAAKRATKRSGGGSRRRGGRRRNQP